MLTLHQKAKMLHCDLKPDNLRWDNGVVKLIDFEHAQYIAHATWAPGTDGYQAPEILNDMPCTVQTDAYSVGRILSRKLEVVRRRKRHERHLASLLQNVSVKLTDCDSQKRWSLTQALHAMQGHQHPHSPQAPDCEAHSVANTKRQTPIMASPGLSMK